MNPVRIATRTSALAMVQARSVADGLERAGVLFEIVGISTRGDRDVERPLTAIGGDGVFTKELESALLDGRADVAVHSMKDLPTAMAAGLRIGAVLEREDARDVLISRERTYAGLAALPRGALVGTSSLRRRAMIAMARPDLELRDLRGNVDTRIRKVLEGALDAAVLALAGVKRIGLLGSIGGAAPVAIEEMVPAVGQGAICAQIREGDDRIAEVLAPLDHSPTALATSMERAFLRRMGGGCLVPIGAHAYVKGDAWRIDAVVAAVDGSAHVRRTANGTLTSEAELIAAAESLADDMLESGGSELVAGFRAAIARGT